VTYGIETATGEGRTVWDQGQGVFDADGVLLGVEGFMVDVTERARALELLEERVDERTHELRMLLDVSRVIAATLDLDELIERVFDQMTQLIAYSGAVIVLREQDGFYRRASRHYGGGRPLEPRGHRYRMDPEDPIEGQLLRGTPLVIDDTLDDTIYAQSWRGKVGDQLDYAVQHVRSWMAVPMLANEQVIGFISLSHREPRNFTPHHVTLIAAIANHIATAVENARLHGQARRLAAVEERQRLARELHDSVSQALYGISLGAQTARALLDRDPSDLRPPLDYILELADAGLAEMRALIFELRPESLETEGLVAALQKRVSAVRARHRLSVDLTTCEEPEWLSLDAKEALYRIAQESIHNTVKHAGATWIGVRLAATPETVILEVVDDGRGFDAGGSFPGHLGLVSMRERIVRLAGSLSIESAPGAGTSVRAELRRQAE
jgi:signal transduction histidine kinase